MTERAAHLVEAVLPRVPVRQWVLTLPYRLRYRLAWDHGLTRAVLGIYAQVLQDFYAREARRHGLGGGRTGLLTVIQRFGGGVNLNVHFHTLVLDGVFVERAADRLQFHPAPRPTDADVAQVLTTIRHRVGRLLARRGLEPGAAEPGPADGLADLSPVLARILGASVQGQVALGQQAGTRVGRLGGALPPAPGGRGPRQARLDGFDLHADVRVPPNDRARLEHLCRYLLRPPLVQDRLRLRADGRVAIKLKRAWHDGTTYRGAGRLQWGQQPGRVRLSGRDLRLVHQGVRRMVGALALAPMRLLPDYNVPGVQALAAAHSEPDPGPWGRWRSPEARVSIRYARVREDALVTITRVEPPYVGLLFAAGEVLSDAVAWLRYCVVCGRLFVRVRQKAVCSQKCRSIRDGRGRSRKGDSTEHRGRPRQDYMTPVWDDHAAWLAKP